MRNLLVLLSFCFVVTNLFAQTPDPAKLKSEGDNALKAKSYAISYANFAKTGRGANATSAGGAGSANNADPAG